jgi:hypothetical protein
MRSTKSCMVNGNVSTNADPWTPLIAELSKLQEGDHVENVSGVCSAVG